jgi:hypothetical protein
MDYQIRFRCRVNPAVNGISFTHAEELETTKARLERQEYEIVSVHPMPAMAASPPSGTAA